MTKELHGADVELRFLTTEQGGRSAALLISPGTTARTSSFQAATTLAWS